MEGLLVVMEVVAVVNDSDPIYALSTPYGRSALCIIRVTGASLPRGFLEYVGLAVSYTHLRAHEP